MGIGVGDGVQTREVAVEAAPPLPAEWVARVRAAWGGAVVVVCLLMLGSSWTTGLRPSTPETLRSDIGSGSVTQWYAASSLDKGPLGVARAEQSGTSSGPSDPFVVEDGTGVAPEGYPDGGILVWRTWRESGWSVTGPGGAVSAQMSAGAAEESTALVRQLREAQVPMKPFAYPDRPPLDWAYAVGGFLLLLGLIVGPATRVGTKWFWFWLLVGTPLGIGAIAYAVTELVGLRRRPDRPASSRLRGLRGFAASVVISLALGVVAELLRSRGVPLPL